jgi:hypothetical protein
MESIEAEELSVILGSTMYLVFSSRIRGIFKRCSRHPIAYNLELGSETGTLCHTCAIFSLV